ncbi:hypothetical protein [Streptomyces avidinii]|uniref:hypothetical protein n=1 Tax=Streptomyces avidinii TaxID=1895 RepID=UPI00386BC6EC
MRKDAQLVGDVDDALDRADREGFTREPPKTLKWRINFLMRRLKTTATKPSAGISRSGPRSPDLARFSGPFLAHPAYRTATADGDTLTVQPATGRRYTLALSPAA